MWVGSSDQWWKDSWNNNAFARFRRVMKFFGQYLQGEKGLSVLGSDTDWNSAAAKYEKHMGRNYISSYLK